MSQSPKVERLELDRLDATADAARSATAIDLDLVGHVEVAIDVHVGSMQLPLAQLMSLKPGDVVAMREGVDEPVTLTLNGKAVARGELVAVDDQFGVHILEVL